MQGQDKMNAFIDDKTIDLDAMSGDFDAQKTAKEKQKFKKEKWYDDFILLFEMAKDKRFKLAPRSYLSITGAIAYVVLPTDLIPDFIPLAGLIDDALVIKIVYNTFKTEIERYKLFCKT